MSNMIEILRGHAEDLRNSSPTEIAVGHLKEAGVSEVSARQMVAQHYMEKEASEYLASSAGIDIEQAVALVKAAGVNVADLATIDVTKTEENLEADLLEKAAQYIELLESELYQINSEKDTLEKAAHVNAVNQIKLPEPIEKLASSGMFTNEDLAQLKSYDQGLLHKVASNISDTPWELGQGYGVAHTQTDPLLAWILES